MSSSPYSILLLLLLLILPISFLLLLALIARPRPTRIPIKSRHVFITGGSSGIGLAIAHLAAAEGARISILARNRRRLDEAREAIRLATGAEVGVYSVDVRDAEAVARAIEEAGPIDVLICNQGVFTPQELEKQEMDEIRFMVDVNLMGTFHLIKAALPEMKRRTKETGVPASIAIMSAQGGQVGVYGYAAYSASKFALRGLSEALQHEVIADNIYVSLIFPSDTNTPGLAEELRRRPEISKIIAGSSGAMKTDDVAKKSLNGIKAGRFIVPCNFEGAILAIVTAGLSPQSSFMAAFVEEAEIRDKKNTCYADIESGLWGWRCKSSITDKENCALRCLSPACYQLIYESDPLEEGEKDHSRSHEYKYCLHKESLGESLEGVKGAFE